MGLCDGWNACQRQIKNIWSGDGMIITHVPQILSKNFTLDEFLVSQI